MSKPDILRAFATAGILAAALAAQRGIQPLPGLPVVPVGHPALAAQPLLDNGGQKVARRDVKIAEKSTKPTPMPPETSGVQVSGDELRAAVKKVAALPWHRKLHGALSRAERDGKPVLLLQTLGDLDGFA